MQNLQENWPDLAGRLEAGVHRLGVRVYYEDTDFTGIVYHATYVRFFERGRSDFLRLAGIHHHELQQEAAGGLAFAVRKMNLEFLKPATIDNILVVETRLMAHRGARIELQQSILRGEELLVQAEVHVAVITSEGRPTRLPLALSEKLSAAGPF
ncbi:tol-pal system-associated acyl-CoA thioesterase [Roseibium limicola]|uniref:Tol-pal system-associated acyl-CoA thioesterase n=1 Tax=Roseibium limicola TaxID=2816037 RepID=A0A939JAG4_9HYPH|nr:tol-pal system-associated acyl-CoA thioesterase [Roseibium limicola]MBO0346914.1 tol-pal system-associated acyl-CoA thioesterase [Roseibium limicola]